MSDRHTRRIYLALAEGRDLSADDERHLATCDACRRAAEQARDFERALHRDLAGTAVPLPADPRGTPADPTRRGTIGLVAALVLVGAIGVGGAAAMLGSPEPAPAPDPTPSAVAATAQPTATPPAMSPSPPATATPSFGQLAAGDYAQLAVRALSLHDRPDGEPFTGINPGADLWIVEVHEDWYLVEALREVSTEYVFGWVPTTTTTDTGGGPEEVATLRELAPGECENAMPWIYVTLAYHPQRQLECLSGQPVVFEGYATDLGASDDRSYGGEPAWLAQAPELTVSSVIGPAVTGFSVFAHLPPGWDSPIPMSDRDGHEGVLLRITGHFDDPASVDCERVRVTDGYPSMDQRLSELWCRQQLVVDAVEVAPVATEWDEPPAYSFMLASGCGERNLIGLFRIDVEDGAVVGLEGLDDQGRAAAETLRLEDVPTIPEFVELAAQARRTGADEVTLSIDPTDGVPLSLTIDWQFDVTDDEECYTVSDVASG